MTSKYDLKNKINQFEKSKEIPNWDKKKADWISIVNNLYEEILKYYEDLINEGKIKVEYELIEIEEEYFDRYSVNRLLLSFADVMVFFEPVKRFVVGGNGRIDVYSSNNYFQKYFLILKIDPNNPEVYAWTLYNDNKEEKGLFLAPDKKGINLLDKLFESWIII